MIRVLVAYLPAALWAAVLFLLGGQQELRGLALPAGVDKLVHLGLYAVLGGLAGWGWFRARRWPAAWWPIAAVMLVGACDEMHQRTVPGRSAEIMDFLADAAGAVVAFGLVGWWAARRSGRDATDES